MSFADLVLAYYLRHECACSLQQLADFHGRSKFYMQNAKGTATFAEVERIMSGKLETYRPTLLYVARRLRAVSEQTK